MHSLLRCLGSLLIVVCATSSAGAGPIIVTALPGGPFTDPSGNSVSIVPNPIDDLAEAYPLALLKDVQISETIAVGFTFGALSWSASGIVTLLEGIVNNSAATWSSLLLTAEAPSGGGAAFSSTGIVMTQPGTVTVGPEVVPGFVTAALLSFDAPVRPGESFLFAFSLFYDVSSVNGLTGESIALAMTETPRVVSEPGIVWLFAPAAFGVLRRQRKRWRSA